MFKVTSFGLNTRTETSAPLVNGVVNNALFHCVPHVNQTLPQIAHVLHFRLVDSLLHQAPDFVVYWIEVGAVRRPKIQRDESRNLVFKIVSRARCAGALSCWNMKNLPGMWR